MNPRLKSLCVAVLILAAGVTGVMIGREAKSSEDMMFDGITVTEGGRPYRHGSHFTTSIALPTGPSASSYVFSKTTVANQAQFVKANGTPSNVFWDVYSQSPSVDGKRLVIVFIAKHPKGPGVIDQAAGTGTILVSTTDNGTCPPTTTSTGITTIPVTPVDSNPCP
jgi:hypothetical protein